MTYAITLIKGKPKERTNTHKLLRRLKNDADFLKRTGVQIDQVFISFGWPDFVLILKGDNVELLKRAIVILRSEAENKGDELETSTLICTKQEEIDKKKGGVG